MADWLLFIFKLGGCGAVLVLVLLVMGKWLLKQIVAALNSYVTAYAQETAKIDARVERLERLAEEQARLTRIVEDIKDEIAAQAKSRDNRWAFRKDVYVNLINATTGLIGAYSDLISYHPRRLSRLAFRSPIVRRNMVANANNLNAFSDEFAKYVQLAPLAMADSVVQLVSDAVAEMGEMLDGHSPDYIPDVKRRIGILKQLRVRLQDAGRKNLWESPEMEAKT